MATPWGGLATGLAQGTQPLVQNSLDMRREQAKQMLQGMIEGNVTTGQVEPGQPQINWGGQTFNVGGLKRQQQQAAIESSQAQTKLAGATTGQTEATTGAMPVKFQLEQQQRNLEQDKANYQRDIQQHQQAQNFYQNEEKQELEKATKARGLLGNFGVSIDKATKSKLDIMKGDLDRNATELQTRGALLDKQEQDLRQKSASLISGLGNQSSSPTDNTQNNVLPNIDDINAEIQRRATAGAK